MPLSKIQSPQHGLQGRPRSGPCPPPLPTSRTLAAAAYVVSVLLTLSLLYILTTEMSFIYHRIHLLSVQFIGFVYAQVGFQNISSPKKKPHTH